MKKLFNFFISQLLKVPLINFDYLRELAMMNFWSK